MNDDKYIKIERVAVAIDVSIQTINNWYRFKREHPDNEYALLLPDYMQEGERKTRYWSKNDIKQLKKFKKLIPHGCAGIMGSVTHRKKEDKDGEKEL